MELVKQNKNASIKVNQWKEVNLGKSSLLKARIGWQGLTTAEYLKSGDYYLVTGTDFSNGFIDWNNCVYVEKERYDQDKFIQVKVNDILVTKDGTIGKVAFIDKVTKPTTLNSGVFVIRPINNAYDPAFLYHMLMSNHFVDFLKKLTAGSTISHLYQKDFIHYSFPAPPTLTEQKAIAKALSDVDELITKLEKLIEKKKAIKQGAMQQLLTPPHKGGKRLKGFSGEWVEVKLGEIGEITGAGVDKKTIAGEPPVRLLNYMDVMKRDYIFNNELNHEVTAPYPKTISCNVHKGDIFLTPSSELRTDIGVSAIAMEDMKSVVYSYHVYRLRYTVDIEKFYGLFLLKTKHFLDQAEKLCEGSGKRYVVSMNKFREMIVYMPKDIAEQKVISEILIDMDKEINKLEAKMIKYESIKQGMMQELLTGKTRLI